MRRRFAKPSKKATAPVPTNSNRANARSGIFAGRKKSSKKATKGNRLFMADKTQACAADQVAREMTTQELLNEVLKAELRQLPG
jgi:hypothetical protein